MRARRAVSVAFRTSSSTTSCRSFRARTSPSARRVTKKSCSCSPPERLPRSTLSSESSGLLVAFRFLLSVPRRSLGLIERFGLRFQVLQSFERFARYLSQLSLALFSFDTCGLPGEQGLCACLLAGFIAQTVLEKIV